MHTGTDHYRDFLAGGVHLRTTCHPAQVPIPDEMEDL